MTIPKFDQLTGNESLPQLIEMVAKLQKQVQWLMDGKIGSDNIRANSIVAEKMDVNELSAITANMGKLTSGEIYGAYIATAEGTFPRAEMSSADDLFGAYSAADKFVQVKALDGTTSTPAIVLRDGSGAISGLMYLDSTLSEFNIGTTRNIRISSGITGYTRVDSELMVVDWTNVINQATSQTLQTALNNKANGSGLSRTVYVSLTSGGPATSPMTISNGIVTS